MWTIRRSHQHIKRQTLSEYLDSRLRGAALARVDQQLASCGVCRDEMESLRATVTLLRGLPVEAPRRSFTMATPPPEPVRVRPTPLLRVPQWAYAGAASAAVILLVVLVSADTTGLLAPEEPTASRASATAPPQADMELAMAGSETAVPGPDDGAFAAPAPAAAQPAPAEEMAAEPSPAPLAPTADAGAAAGSAAAPAKEAEETTTRSQLAGAGNRVQRHPAGAANPGCRPSR